MAWHSRNVREDYVDDLRASCASLTYYQGRKFEIPNPWPASEIRQALQGYLDNRNKYFDVLDFILAQTVTSSGSLGGDIAFDVGRAPRIPPTFWLGQLHRDRSATLSKGWKEAIIHYGLAVTELRRAQRLIAAAASPADLIEELDHVGHSNWQPEDFPETLLLEAESGILIRHEQERIASHMRNPGEAQNIALQLLMGGGKSSTIVPILAAYLTDREK